MKEFKHSCTRALHLTSCDFPARGPSVSHPKPLLAPGDPAGGGNVRAGAERAAPRSDAVLPSRGGGRNAAAQTEAGPGSVRAKTDLAGRTVKSTTHVCCHLRPTQTLSALLLITMISGRFTIPPWASPGAPARTLSPREDPTRPSAESENPRARHRNGTDWPLDILWRVPPAGPAAPRGRPLCGHMRRPLSLLKPKPGRARAATPASCPQTHPSPAAVYETQCSQSLKKKAFFFLGKAIFR